MVRKATEIDVVRGGVETRLDLQWLKSLKIKGKNNFLLYIDLPIHFISPGNDSCGIFFLL